MIHILLVDDHPVVRKGIRTILKERLHGAIIGEASDGPAALQQIRDSTWDVIVVDISLPSMSGLDLIKEIHRIDASIPTIVLSMHPTAQVARRAIKAGAVGYLTKDSAPDELIAAVNEVRNGRPYVSGDVRDLRTRRSPTATGTAHESLSDREYQTLRLLGSGRTISDIARDLGLSVKTISTYRMRVLEKLGMRTNAEIMRYAIENGLIDS